ncbi:hypothetical protein H5410_034513 [Solanum commersonii]|uniref:Uncharacterized protein n=1 Tax=Solanum commersonii TaxID=4109 RepID=A0A9J5YTL3_SOLCO|nr:hypothetical protein H5410_034513 [Solanum commersonii]
MLVRKSVYVDSDHVKVVKAEIFQYVNIYLLNFVSGEPEICSLQEVLTIRVRLINEQMILEKWEPPSAGLEEKVRQLRNSFLLISLILLWTDMKPSL